VHTKNLELVVKRPAIEVAINALEAAKNAVIKELFIHPQ